MRIAWISYLDAQRFSGGGERSQRRLISAGRCRGHAIGEAAFLRSRPQRALRRAHLYRRFAVDWNADLFVLANIRNSPHLAQRIPETVIDRVLDCGRVAILQNAWVDICALDLPCGGDPAKCPPECDRGWSNRLFGSGSLALFTSPRHARLAEAVLDVELPPVIHIRPCVDVGSFRPLGGERDLDVLYVGVISRAKGYYNLVERFGAARLTLAGRNMLGHPVAGRYLGELPYSRLPALYNRARIFAHLPEWEEPMGRSVVEAQLCGCEVIVNGRVGVTSYPRSEWSSPEAVARSETRFWEELEAAADETA